MDRVELRKKFAGKIQKFRLDEFDLDLNLRGLSGLARAKLGDKFKLLDKVEADNAAETAVIEVQCRVVAQGLVDESGQRIYRDDEYAAIAEEIPATALDKISKEILRISGLGSTEIADAAKNSNPTPSADLLSGSEKPSEGGI